MGIVKDSKTGLPIKNANIGLGDSASIAKTNADGQYSVTDCPPGSHNLFAWRENYSMKQKTTNVPAGGTVKVNFELEFTTETTTLPTTTSTTSTITMAATVPPATTSTSTSTLEETTTPGVIAAEPTVLLDLEAPKYVQPGKSFDLVVRITAHGANSGRLTNSISCPEGFYVRPSENWSVANIMAGKTRELARTVVIGDGIGEGEGLIIGEVFNDSGNVVSSGQITVNVKRPYVIGNIEIPKLEVLQEKAFHIVNNVFRRLLRNTAVSLVLLMLLAFLFYVYYRSRRPDERGDVYKGSPK